MPQYWLSALRFHQSYYPIEVKVGDERGKSLNCWLATTPKQVRSVVTAPVSGLRKIFLSGLLPKT
jgi:hypothetical protein